MTHRFLSTDYGVHCFACGIVLDYLAPDDGDAPSLVTDERTEIEAMRYLPWCTGPITERAHHYVYAGDRLECAYGDSVITAETMPADIVAECRGDAPMVAYNGQSSAGRGPYPCKAPGCGLVYTPGFYAEHARSYHGGRS